MYKYANHQTIIFASVIRKCSHFTWTSCI